MRHYLAAVLIGASLATGACGRAPVPEQSSSKTPETAPPVTPAPSANMPAAEQQTLRPVDTADLLALLRTINPDLRRVSVVGTASLASGDELMVVASALQPVPEDLVVLGHPPPPAPEPVGPGFDWDVDAVLALVVRSPGGAAPRMLTSVQHQEDGCCFGRVMTLTTSEVALTSEAEKFQDHPTMKFFVDASAQHARRVDYMPFRYLSRKDRAGIPAFEFSNGERVVIIRPTQAAPFLEIATARDAVGQETGRFPAQLDVARSIAGYTLPQAVPVEPGQEPAETIGPTMIEGTKIWFGKTFEMGQGRGGFGYFDPSTGTSQLFTPDDMKATSALLVEPNTIWLGLFYDGDWGASGEGLLRVRRPSMDTETLAVDDVIHTLVRFGSRVYAVAERGVWVVAPDGSIEPWFVDIDAAGKYQLRRPWVPPARK